MKEYRLGDIIDIKHGYAFDGDHIVQEDNGIVLVTPGNFRIGGGFQEEKCKFFTGEIPDDYVLSAGDFIVTMTDLSKEIDTLGYSAIVPDTNRTYLHNQRIGLVSFKNNECHPGYIYFLMRTHQYQRSIANTSTGATVHHTSPSKICDYQFYAPSYEKQRRIAEYLFVYEKLTENNQKQIKLLEEAAQRLYKEWFVDLRFPGHETTPIVDGVPEGWASMAINDIAEYINGYAFKPSDWGTKGKPIIKIKEMGSGITADTPRNRGEGIPAKYIVTAGDILFSWSATLSAMIWDEEDGLLNQHLFKVIPHNGISREFILQSILKALDEFSNLTTGSTMKHIQRGKLKEVFVNVPDNVTMRKYESISEPMREQILTLKKQIILLKEARDRLLPKLMSGEIEV